MKNLVILTALGALAAVAINSHAQTMVVDFTAAQGYVNGPLHTQDGYKWWCNNPPNINAWQVDTNGTGKASVASSEGDWKQIVYDLGLTYSEGYKGTIDFTVTVSNTVASRTTITHFGIENSADSYHGPGFELSAEPGGGFSLSIWNSSSSTYASSSAFGGADIGLPGGVGTSAKLRMAFTTTTNAGAGTWTTVLSLTNLGTATGTATVTDAGWTAPGAATHVYIEQAMLNTVTGNDGGISVDQITMAPVSSTPPPPPPSKVIEFTAAQGYMNGNLHTQDTYNWWANADTNAWQVDTNGAGYATIFSSAGDWKEITYNLGSPFTNGYTGTFEFSFTNSTPAASEQHVVFCKVQDSEDGYRGPSFEFKATPYGDCVMGMWNEVSSGFVKKNFSASSVGMLGGVGTSQRLRMVFTTTPAGAGTWTTVYMLQNLDASTTLGALTETGWTGHGWASHLSMTDGPLNEFTAGNEALIKVDRITMGSLTAPAAPTVIGIQNLGNGQFSLQWTNGGTLLETTNVPSGTWQAVSGATSPYTNTLTGAQKFFRVQVSP
jgi:hypothetical protein